MIESLKVINYLEEQMKISRYSSYYISPKMIKQVKQDIKGWELCLNLLKKLFDEISIESEDIYLNDKEDFQAEYELHHNYCSFGITFELYEILNNLMTLLKQAR